MDLLICQFISFFVSDSFHNVVFIYNGCEIGFVNKVEPITATNNGLEKFKKQPPVALGVKNPFIFCFV